MEPVLKKVPERDPGILADQIFAVGSGYGVDLKGSVSVFHLCSTPNGQVAVICGLELDSSVRRSGVGSHCLEAEGWTRERNLRHVMRHA